MVINELTNIDAPLCEWVNRLSIHQRCLAPDQPRGFCANPIQALGDCLLRLLRSKASVDRELYASHCHSLYTAIECLLRNVSAKEELQQHMSYLVTGFRLESDGHNTPAGDYLNQLVRVYINSLGGSETW